jgi:hypothetical protein
MTTLPMPSPLIYVKYVTMEGPLMPTLSRLLARASSEVLEDEINLLLLRNLVSGRCVSVNLSALSKATGRHRITVRNELPQ